MSWLSKCVFGALWLALAMGARAGDADFTLVNRTGYDIESVFVVPTKRRDWGDDYLGDNELRNGRSVKITFSKNSNHCIYDLKVHWVGYGDDEDTTWEKLDLCKVRTLTLRYNRKTNETIAEFD